MEFLRAQREKRDALIINDPQPFASLADLWEQAAQMATVGIFVLLAVACLYFCRPILLPVMAAVLIGTTFAPLLKFASRYGLSPWATSIVIVALMGAGAALAVTLLAAPITQWMGRAPEIGASIKERLYVFDRPLAAFHQLEAALRPAGPAVGVELSNISMVTPLAAAITPAVTESVLFFATLIFYMAGQMKVRHYLAAFFASRDGKLRFIRITNDIEHNLASYVAIVTVINAVLGTIVACGAWLIGLPSPIILGVLAMLLNYIPYLGPACVAFILFAVGFVHLPFAGTSGHRAGILDRSDNPRGPPHHPDRAGPPPDSQSACGLSRHRLLGLAVGPDGSLPRGPVVDLRAGDGRSRISVERGQAAGMIRNFCRRAQLECRRISAPFPGLETSLMSNNSSMARDGVNDANGEAGKTAAAAAGNFQDDLAALRDDVARLTQQIASKAKSNMEGVISEAQDKGMEAIDAVREVGDNMVDAIDESLKKRPYTTLALALGIGFLFGATWRR